MKFRITWPAGSLVARMDDTPTAKAVFAALPCESKANTWGEEVYFELPIRAKLEANAQQVVAPGTVCFWVEGNSLALPFGPTPISRGAECRLAGRVNLLGKIEGDPRDLASVRSGDFIRVEAAE